MTGIAAERGLMYPRHMDALDKMIADKEAEVAGLQERMRTLQAELDALRLAAELRPATTSKKPGPRQRAGGGRRQGDISKEWRAILESIYRVSRRVSYEDISELAAELGNDLAASSVRDRVRNMTRTGLMTGNPQEGFAVTVAAVERFGFTKGNGGSAGPSEAHGEGDSSALAMLYLQPRPDRQ